MGDNWSVNADNTARVLIPSAGPVSHPDPRMHLTLRDMPDVRPAFKRVKGPLFDPAIARRAKRRRRR